MLTSRPLILAIAIIAAVVAVTAAAVFLALVSDGDPPVSPQTQAVPVPAKAPAKYENVSTGIHDLVEEVESGQTSVEDAASKAPLHYESLVAVEIYVDGDVEELTKSLEANGAAVIGADEGYVEAYVPLTYLGEASALPRVEWIRWIVPPVPDETPTPTPRSTQTSPGPAVEHGAPAWHGAGYTGYGIKVGILDAGFVGYRALMGTELPETVHVRCYSSKRLLRHSDSISDCEHSSNHGTAVAEALIDMAPDVTLFVAQPNSKYRFKKTVDWMISEGVSVINMSMSYPWEGPGDGTSPFGFSLLKMVDRAVSGGVVWVNSAGNKAEATWSGGYSDSDRDGWIEFTTSDETNNVEIRGGAIFQAQLRWIDPLIGGWGPSSIDLDLYLYDSSGKVVSSSRDPQNVRDPFPPYEYLRYHVPEGAGGLYSLRVAYRGDAPDPPERIQLQAFSNEDLEHATAAGSITNPADSGNPGMLTVGAAAWNSWERGAVRGYSGRGPTSDGRIKPEIVGADGVTSAARNGRIFTGTSQAAPHVAGLVALVRQRYPELSPSDVAQFLKDQAVAPQGVSVPNNEWGHGFAHLPADEPEEEEKKEVTSVPGTLLWRFETVGTDSTLDMVRTPAVDGGMVYVAASEDNFPFAFAENRVYALDASTGEPLWQYKTRVDVSSVPPIVSNGVVHFAFDVRHGVKAFDVATGHRLWVHTPGGWDMPSIAEADGVIFATSPDNGPIIAWDASNGDFLWRSFTTWADSVLAVFDGVLYAKSRNRLQALDASTGEGLWSYQDVGGKYLSPMVSHGMLYFGTVRGTVSALDAATGELQWSYDTESKGASPSIVVDGTVHVRSDSGQLYALDAETGELVWRYDVAEGELSASTVANGVVYVGSEAGRLYALDAATGELRWQYETGGPGYYSPVVSDGVVYVGSGDEHLYALDAQTGELLWRYETGRLAWWTIPTVADGAVYIETRNGYLYAIGAGARPDGSTTVPGSTPFVSPKAPAHRPQSEGAFVSMLRFVPDIPAARQFIWINDYAAARQAFGIDLPGEDADDDSLVAYSRRFIAEGESQTEVGPPRAPGMERGPWLSGIHPFLSATVENRAYLGFAVRHVDQTAKAGMNPDILEIVEGRFDPESTNYAIGSCTHCLMPQYETHEGIGFYSWGEDYMMSFPDHLSPPAFDNQGRSSRIAVTDNYVLRTTWTSGMLSLIDAYLGVEKSIADNPDALLVAEFMDSLGAYSGVVFSDVSPLDSSQFTMGRTASDEARRPVSGSVDRYSALGVGIAKHPDVDEDPHVVAVFVYDNDEDAERNEDSFQTTLKYGTSCRTNRPWTSILPVVPTYTVRSHGRVVIAEIELGDYDVWPAVVALDCLFLWR